MCTNSGEERTAEFELVTVGAWSSSLSFSGHNYNRIRRRKFHSIWMISCSAANINWIGRKIQSGRVSQTRGESNRNCLRSRHPNGSTNRTNYLRATPRYWSTCKVCSVWFFIVSDLTTLSESWKPSRCSSASSESGHMLAGCGPTEAMHTVLNS